MTNNKKLILETIRANPNETMGGIAKILGLCYSCVTKHIGTLLSEGKIISKSKIRKSDKRPILVFSVPDVKPEGVDPMIRQVVMNLTEATA